jgi:transcription elongation factor/antiterminator RfaH
MKMWYVVHSKPQKEALLCEQLNSRRIETYYPRIRVKPINPRAHKIKPYFPGYLFICVDLNKEITSSLRWMPGAMDLVCFGDEPAVVPDELIQKIKQEIDSINHVPVKLFDGLEPGVQIVIRDGPFQGYEAIFDARLSGTKRVRVLLELLKGRKYLVELPVDQIERKKRF